MSSIAFCGLDCFECPVYIATQQQDDARKQKLAAEYSTPALALSAADISCAGCFSDSVSGAICGGCPMRECALGRTIGSCGYCEQYPCERIERHVAPGSDNRRRLDELAKSKA